MRKEFIEKVKSKVKELEPLADLILFGSRARMDSTDVSDWDFLILVDGAVDTSRCDRIRHGLYEIEWETGEVISSIIKSKELWSDPGYKDVPLFQSVQKEGILL